MGNVTLRTKKIANGKRSLYLDYFPEVISPKTGKTTRREFLKLYIHEKPKDEIQKKHNSTQVELAEHIRSKRLLDIRNKEFGLKEHVDLDVNFFDFYKSIVDNYYNNGSRGNYYSWKSSLDYWNLFIGNKLMSKQLTPYHVEKYREFLLSVKSIKSKRTEELSRNTASTYFKNFINVLKKANKKKLLASNLADDAEYIKEEETHREYLTEDELATLWKKPVKLPILKNMAFFSVMTGLRFSDIVNLKWEDIFYDRNEGYYIRLKEQKTKNIQNHFIPENAYKLLPKKGNGKVFKDIKYTQITRPLKEWISSAEINKHITFHNFRHTFATLQLSKGTDVYTLSKMMGHKNVMTTQIYGKVMDRQKIEASQKMNLDFDGL